MDNDDLQCSVQLIDLFDAELKARLDDIVDNYKPKQIDYACGNGEQLSEVLFGIQKETKLMIQKGFRRTLKSPKIAETIQSKSQSKDDIFIAAENYLMSGLFDKIYQQQLQLMYREADAALSRVINSLQHIILEDLCDNLSAEIVVNVPKALDQFKKLPQKSTPRGKLECLVKAVGLLARADEPCSSFGDELAMRRILVSDDLIVCFAYMLLHANVPNWQSSVVLMECFRFWVGESQHFSGEADYYLATLKAAIEYVKVTLYGSERFMQLIVLRDASCDDALVQAIKSLDNEHLYSLLFTSKAADSHHPLCHCAVCKGSVGSSRRSFVVDACLLHVAAFYDNITAIDWLLGLGASVTSTDTASRTPLHIACLCAHMRACLLLLDMSASCLAKDADGNTPLHLAAKLGHTDIVKLILSKLDRMNVSNKSPCGSLGELLLSRNSHGNTILHVAAYWGYEELCRTICSFDGVNRSARNYQGKTAEDVAANSQVRSTIALWRPEVRPTIRRLSTRSASIVASLSARKASAPELRPPASSGLLIAPSSVLPFHPPSDAQPSHCHPLCTCAKCSAHST